MAWAQRSITFGELAARLADGTTITSSAGTLTAVGGGGGMAAAGEILLATTTGVAYTPNAIGGAGPFVCASARRGGR